MRQQRELDIPYFESKLLLERQRLTDERKSIDERLARSAKTAESAESKYDDHMAELGSDALDRDVDLASRDTIDMTLEQIGAALAKIENGTYGTCAECGEEIAPPRLEAQPHALTCVQCQNAFEQRFAPRGRTQVGR